MTSEDDNIIYLSIYLSLSLSLFVFLTYSSVQDPGGPALFSTHVRINATTCKKSDFEHSMQQFFESQHLATTPPSPKRDVVEPHPPLLEQLAKEAANVPLAEDEVDMLSEEDTLAPWVKEARHHVPVV